ncbi:MAG: ABC transporter ATP-binding protein [Patescibacteria group bacterium]
MSYNKVRSISWKRQAANYVYAMRLAWKHSRLVVLTYPVKSIIDGLVPVAQAFLAGALINELILFATNDGSKTKAITLLVVAAALQLMTYLMSMLERYTFVVHRERVEMEMRIGMMEGRVQSDIAHVEIPEITDKYMLAQTGASEALWHVRYVSDMFAAVISLVAIFGSILATVPQALVVLLPIPFIAVRNSIRVFKEDRVYWSERRASRIRAGYIDQMFDKESGIAEIRLFGLSKKILSLYRKNKKDSIDISANKERLTARNQTLMQLLESVAATGVDIWLLFRVFSGAMNVGGFEQSRRLVGAYLAAMNRLSSSVSSIVLYGYHLDDYRLYLDANLDYKGRHQGTKKHRGTIDHIQARRLSFAYPNADSPAIHDVDIDIHRGQSVAIVGENGAGKTTLIKNLMGLYSHSDGQIAYDGIGIDDLDMDSIYKKSASLTQEYSSFDFMTIGESVSMSFTGRYDRKKVLEVLDDVGMKKTVTSLKKGLDTNYGYIEDDGLKLSGGQSQRLAIARILYTDSELLILDEPTSAIDAKSEQQIMDHVFDRYSTRTLVVVSHRLSTVSRCDQIIVMRNGHAVEKGTHKELFKKGTAYYDLFHKQAMRIK